MWLLAHVTSGKSIDQKSIWRKKLNSQGNHKYCLKKIQHLDPQASMCNKWAMKALACPKWGVFPSTMWGMAPGDNGQGRISQRAEQGLWSIMDSSSIKIFLQEDPDAFEVTSIAKSRDPSRVPPLLWIRDCLCSPIFIAITLYIGCMQGWRVWLNS